ncbi:MAG: hypothetical protein IKQ51_02605 [Bacteroidaceae bacterium]|nr:hypothetical protein [Bacteroidaceae bacterium]
MNNNEKNILYHHDEHGSICYGSDYRQPHGGEFSVVALAWLDWQLKKNREAAKMFVGKKNLLSQRKEWTLEKNKKMK